MQGAILWNVNNYQNFKITQGDCGDVDVDVDVDVDDDVDDGVDEVDDVDDDDEHDQAGGWEDTGGGLGALLGHLRKYFLKIFSDDTKI